LASLLAGQGRYLSPGGLLTGQNPIAPQQLPGFMGAQMLNGLSDTSGTAGGLLGALAQGLRGGMGASMLKNAVQNTTDAGLAAQPDLLAAYSSPQGAVNYAAQNPGINKFSLAQILAGATPTSGQAEGLGAINLMRYRTLNGLDPQTGMPTGNGAPSGGGASVVGAPAIGRGAARMAPPPTQAFPQGYNGRATQASGTLDQTLAQLAAAGRPEQRAAIIQSLSPDQLAALQARLSQGNANAAQPGP